MSELGRKAVKDYLLKAAEYADTDLSGLARRAGLSPSTLTRFVNGDAKHLPTTRTLAKIAKASGYAGPLSSGQDQSDLLAAVGTVAAALGVDLTEAAVLKGADRKRLRRAAQWLDLINRLPPTLENNLFETVRGMTETASQTEQETHPSEPTRRRRFA